jgi:trans-2-enoyl-CoA reductase
MLSNYGGDINVPEDYVNSYGFNEMIKDLPPIKLAFNCIGGEGVVDIARVVGKGATLVTYGGMSKEQVAIPSDLISKKLLKLQSFWVTEWAKNHSIAERTTMINDISSLVRSKKLSLLYEMHDFDDFNYALHKSMEPYGLRKIILNMDYPDRLKEHDARPSSDYWVFQTDTV